jgi:hypothetical protein
MSADDRPIINYLIRMVVPMRREFQRHLDVDRFLHEPAYARQILDEALTTQDPRLKEFATYVAVHLRQAAGAPTRPAAPAPAAPVPVSRGNGNGSSTARRDVGAAPPASAREPLKAAQEPSAEEAILLARLERYRTGLR